MSYEFFMLALFLQQNAPTLIFFLFVFTILTLCPNPNDLEEITK